MNSVDHRDSIRKRIMGYIKTNGRVPDSIPVTREELAYLWLNHDLQELSRTHDGTVVYTHRDIVLYVEDK